MTRMRWKRTLPIGCALTLATVGCGGDDSDSAGTTTAPTESSPGTGPTGSGAPSSDASADTGAASNLEAIGLWDDGPCDTTLPTLHVGLQTVFQSGVLSLQDQAQALEAAAVAFNARGGANGHCIEVTTCDDMADPTVALECARTLDSAGVAVTINDTTAVAATQVGAAYAAAGIPRFAISPSQEDFTDLNAYPMDAGGTGTSIMMPQALLDQGLTKIAIVRVDVPSATALPGLIESIYADNGLEVVKDLPVPAGTTDYSQFITAAQEAGAQGIAMPLGGQEGMRVLSA